MSAQLLDRATARLARARLHYGHGTDNPRDDAAALVFHALGLAHESAPASYRLPVTARGAARVDALVERRIAERLPSAYLTGVSWFAGHEIRVTPDVLVPRSPIAELCLAGFAPWIDPARVAPRARHRHRFRLHRDCGRACLAARARGRDRRLAARPARSPATTCGATASAAACACWRADVYEGLGGRRYDVVVSNPPYVPATEMRRLPREHRAEPATALRAARRGLAIVERIVAGARRHLTPAGHPRRRGRQYRRAACAAASASCR